jgi:hypothetical protein
VKIAKIKTKNLMQASYSFQASVRAIINEQHLINTIVIDSERSNKKYQLKEQKESVIVSTNLLC